jgi:hypothetical protein
LGAVARQSGPSRFLIATRYASSATLVEVCVDGEFVPFAHGPAEVSARRSSRSNHIEQQDASESRHGLAIG